MSDKGESRLLDESQKAMIRGLAIDIGCRHPGCLQDVVRVTRLLAKRDDRSAERARQIVREETPGLVDELETLLQLTALEYGK